MFWKLTDLMLAKGMSIFLAIVLITSSFSLTSQANAATSDISVAMKHKKKVSLVAIKNNGDEEVFGVQIKIDDGKIRYVKARGWDRDRIDQGTIIVQASDRPIKPGKSLIMILIVDNRTSSFEWTAFDARHKVLSEGSMLAKQTQKDEISPNFSKKVQSCTRDHPHVTYPDYDKYVDSDCLIEKAHSVGDCKAYENVIIIEFDVINPYTGKIKHFKKYFDKVEPCITNLALRNHDVNACNALDNNTNCIVVYVQEFEEPESCRLAVDVLNCFEAVSLTLGPAVCKLIHSYAKTLDCFETYFTSGGRSSSDETYKQCIDVGLGNFLVKQIACKLESLPLDGMSKEDFLIRNSNGDLIPCLSFEFPSHLDKEEYCIGSLGIYTKELYVCDGAGTARAECYGLLAITEDFVTLQTCDKLDQGVSFCYMAVAYRLNDISICQMEKVADNRDNCIKLVNSRD